MRIALAILFALAMSAVAAAPPITASPWTTNYGNGGSNTMFQMIWSSTSSGHPMDVALTPVGGIAIRMTNGTGSNSVLGQIVQPLAGPSDLVRTYTCNHTNDITSSGDNIFRFIGVVAENGVANGGLVWITVSGVAWVILATDITPYSHGCIAYASNREYGKAGVASYLPVYLNVFTNRIKVVGQMLMDSPANGDGTNLVLIKLQ